MFTRVVEITTKSGKAHEVANTIHEKILPILRKQAGFVDETVLTSETESNRILGLSFWKTREDAERYHREQYPKVNEILSPLLAARGASLDSQRKRLRDSQRSSLQCAHGDGATRAAATTRGVLDRAHGATPDSGAPFLRTAEPAAGGAWV